MMTTTKHGSDKAQDKGQQKDKGQQPDKEKPGSSSRPDKDKSHSEHGEKR